MNNVISFPRQVTEAPQPVRAAGSKTLFIHVKSTTLIAHLAGRTKMTKPEGRVGKNR